MGLNKLNKFKIKLENIQHVKFLEYELDLSKNSLFCLVGKNSIGKTTLIKSIQNFKETNTLDKVSRLNIIKENSKIIYTIDDVEYNFISENVDNRYILDSYDTIDKDLQNNIFTEFPIPYGKRFDIYSKLGGDIGNHIRTVFSKQTYNTKPNELISILNSVYGEDKYTDLEQIEFQNENYYIKPLNAENYIREDDFSSGEFMIIQIYKLIKNNCKLIVIDELDISLDSSAQINLIKELRKLAQQYSFNLLFTTHSLAIMKMMEDKELYFMENLEDKILIENKSYNYIKAELFQFVGYDKIILVEDKMLEEYLKYLIENENIFCKYKIIYIAGASQTIDLMNRNGNQNFFNTKKVISILDGDTKEDYPESENIKHIPFLSIEKELLFYYKMGYMNNLDLNNNVLIDKINSTNRIKAKTNILYDKLQHKMTSIEMFKFIDNYKSQDVNIFKNKILEFLK